MPGHLSNFGNALLNKWRHGAGNLFASHCLLCDEAAPARGICEPCWRELPWLTGPGCEVCAHPLATPGMRMVLFTLTGLTLMVFYVFALQCVSTIVIVRREANGWKWAAFQWFYMGALAWILAFITYHGGRWLGWG